MDQIRLIAFIVFSMAVLLLWEFWQKEHAPPPPQQAITKKEVSGKASAPPLPQNKALESQGRVLVNTDLFTAEIDEQGGDLRKLYFHRYHTRDGQPYVLLSDEPQKIMVIQTGFVGDGPHDTDDGRGAGHVGLHRPHALRRLEGDATRIEGDALAA